MKRRDDKKDPREWGFEVPCGILVSTPGDYKVLCRFCKDLDVPFIHNPWEVTTTSFHCWKTGKGTFFACMTIICGSVFLLMIQVGLVDEDPSHPSS